MKKVLLTGATGMIGGIVQRECLKDSSVGEVVSLVRRPSGITDKKFTEVIHKDFADFSGLEAHFTGVDIAHFCLGVYTGAVPDDQFKVITVDYAVQFADMLKAHSPEATLCFLSGQGADRTEESRMSFAKYKGMAENHLLKCDFPHLYIFRPAYIYPVEKRVEPNLMYRVSRMLYPLLKNLMPGSVITSEQLGQAMFKAGNTGAKKDTLENNDIKEVLK